MRKLLLLLLLFSGLVQAQQQPGFPTLLGLPLIEIDNAGLVISRNGEDYVITDGDHQFFRNQFINVGGVPPNYVLITATYTNFDGDGIVFNNRAFVDPTSHYRVGLEYKDATSSNWRRSSFTSRLNLVNPVEGAYQFRSNHLHPDDNGGLSGRTLDFRPFLYRHIETRDGYRVRNPQTSQPIVWRGLTWRITL